MSVDECQSVQAGQAGQGGQGGRSLARQLSAQSTVGETTYMSGSGRQYYVNMKVNAKSEFVSLAFFLLFSLFLLCEFIARHSGKTAKAKGKKIHHHCSSSQQEQEGWAGRGGVVDSKLSVGVAHQLPAVWSAVCLMCPRPLQLHWVRAEGGG